MPQDMPTVSVRDTKDQANMEGSATRGTLYPSPFASTSPAHGDPQSQSKFQAQTLRLHTAAPCLPSPAHGELQRWEGGAVPPTVPRPHTARFQPASRTPPAAHGHPQDNPHPHTGRCTSGVTSRHRCPPYLPRCGPRVPNTQADPSPSRPHGFSYGPLTLHRSARNPSCRPPNALRG